VGSGGLSLNDTPSPEWYCSFMNPPSVLSASFSLSFSYAFFYPDLFLIFVFHFIWFLSSHSFVAGVGDMGHSLWWGGFTRNRKQVVNIAQDREPVWLSGKALGW